MFSAKRNQSFLEKLLTSDVCQEILKMSLISFYQTAKTTTRIMLKGLGHQPEKVTAGQRWDNLNFNPSNIFKDQSSK